MDIESVRIDAVPPDIHGKHGGGTGRPRPRSRRHLEVVESAYLHGGTAASRGEVPPTTPTRLPPVSANPPGLMVIVIAAFSMAVASLVVVLSLILP